MTSRTVVLCSLEPWDDVWRRNQYLAHGLLTSDPRWRVLVVEPPADPLHAALSGRAVRKGNGLRSVPGYDGRLHALQSTKWLPRLLGDTVDRALDRAVVQAVRHLGWSSPTVWINDPRRAGVVSALGAPAVYDITDDWVLADRGPRESERLRRTDAWLLERADRVVVCSPRLQATKGGTLLTNAVEVDRYRTAAPRPGDLPPSPIALYCGTLHEDRLDVDLCITSAAAMAAIGGSLVLVGPDALDPAASGRLRAATGVVVLGARHRDEVPGYLQHADVLVVPHRVDAFTETLDPIKLYEYRAVGRPVVSTPVAGFRDAPGVEIAPVDRLASVAVEAATSSRATTHHADVPDWRDRAREFGEILAEVADGRGPR
ncbi:glycosyltransferase [Demequina sp. NBRC 110053]|uniref:glycosyltransferase n=1 Tax=Demequina sp. NBRC 110053 TaxID=1570342 RepID=UPI000A064847|nr:glycosyltransferase [Demequina sp. NBRC 110053]